MRTSRVVFAGIAVAAAAATTSAFTASNGGMNQTDTAGYGENTVTGTTVSNVAYVPLSSDGTYLDHVEFTLGTDITGKPATLTLKSGTTVVQTPTQCTVDTAWAGSSMTITCPPAANTRIDAFDAVGLTVTQ